MKDNLTTEVKWNANKEEGKPRFTQRQREQIAYRAIARMIVRIEGMPDQKSREDAENGLATLLSEAPACPSLALLEGLDYIEQVRRDIVKAQKAADAEKRRKISASSPLAIAARGEETPDPKDFALMVIKRSPGYRVPRRSS